MLPENSAPAPAPSTSLFKKVIYVLIILVALSLVLQFLGINILGHRESDTLIERPHQNYVPD